MSGGSTTVASSTSISISTASESYREAGTMDTGGHERMYNLLIV